MTKNRPGDPPAGAVRFRSDSTDGLLLVGADIDVGALDTSVSGKVRSALHRGAEVGPQVDGWRDGRYVEIGSG